MSYNARLMNEPRIRALVELMDDLANHAQEAADAFAEYESAKDLPSSEQTDAREEARDTVWAAIGDMRATYAKFDVAAKALEREMIVKDAADGKEGLL